MQAIIFLKQYGFFLQLLFPMIIFMTNGKKRKYFLIRLLGVMLITFPLYFLPNLTLYKINYSYILSDIILFVLSFLLYDETPFVLFFTSIASFGLQHIIWNNFCLLFDSIPSMASLHPVVLNLIFFLNLGITYLLVFLLMYHSKLKITYRPRQWFSYVLSLVVLLFVIFLAQLIPLVQEKWNFVNRLYANLAVLLCLIIQFGYPYLYDIIQKDRELFEEKRTLENMLSVQAKQQRLGKEATDILNLKIHDMKNQLNTIKHLHGQDRIDSIDELEKSVDIYSNIAKTGNDALDIVLTQKGLLCNSKKITFTYIIDGKAFGFMKATDITSLFGNILDNAIESAEKEEGEYRLIKLSCETKKDFLQIQETNYCHQKLYFENGVPVSTKKDKDSHGFGIRSISYIISKYQGKIKITQEEDIFRLYILIPCSAMALSSQPTEKDIIHAE